MHMGHYLQIWLPKAVVLAAVDPDLQIRVTHQTTEQVRPEHQDREATVAAALVIPGKLLAAEEPILLDQMELAAEPHLVVILMQVVQVVQEKHRI
jgi:hypothetical protein